MQLVGLQEREATPIERTLFSSAEALLRAHRPHCRAGRLVSILIPGGHIERDPRDGSVRVRVASKSLLRSVAKVRSPDADEIEAWRRCGLLLGLADAETVGDFRLVRLTLASGIVLKRSAVGDRILVIYPHVIVGRDYFESHEFDGLHRALLGPIVVEPEPPQTFECGTCGALVPEDATACPACGVFFALETPQPEPEIHLGMPQAIEVRERGKAATNADDLVAVKGQVYAPGGGQHKIREHARTKRSCPLCRGPLYNPPHVHRILSAGQITKGGPIRDVKGQHQYRFSIAHQVALDVGLSSRVREGKTEADLGFEARIQDVRDLAARADLLKLKAEAMQTLDVRVAAQREARRPTAPEKP